MSATKMLSTTILTLYDTYKPTPKKLIIADFIIYIFEDPTIETPQSRPDKTTIFYITL